MHDAFNEGFNNGWGNSVKNGPTAEIAGWVRRGQLANQRAIVGFKDGPGVGKKEQSRSGLAT